MIEAVNSVIASAPLLRGNAEQGSSVRAVQSEAVRELPQAPYVSPYIFVDNNYNKAVLQIRDSDTGDVLRQFPSEQRLEVIRQQQFQETRVQRPDVKVAREDAQVQRPEPAVVEPQVRQAAPQTSDRASSQVAAAALSTAAQTAQPATGGSVVVTTA